MIGSHDIDQSYPLKRCYMSSVYYVKSYQKLEAVNKKHISQEKTHLVYL